MMVDDMTMDELREEVMLSRVRIHELEEKLENVNPNVISIDALHKYMWKLEEKYTTLLDGMVDTDDGLVPEFFDAERAWHDFKSAILVRFIHRRKA